MRLSPPGVSIGKATALSPIDDSYHAFLDLCWLRMLAAHVSSSSSMARVHKRFYVMHVVRASEYLHHGVRS